MNRVVIFYFSDLPIAFFKEHGIGFMKGSVEIWYDESLKWKVGEILIQGRDMLTGEDHELPLDPKVAIEREIIEGITGGIMAHKQGQIDERIGQHLKEGIASDEYEEIAALAKEAAGG